MTPYTGQTKRSLGAWNPESMTGPNRIREAPPRIFLREAPLEVDFLRNHCSLPGDGGFGARQAEPAIKETK